MQFKTQALRRSYVEGPLHPKVKAVCELVDAFVKLWFICKKRNIEMTVTCVERLEDTDSYHSKWKAVDVRTKDWSGMLTGTVSSILTIVKATDPMLQFEFEQNPSHLHIEYDDGTINKQTK